jgi:hypothetical protein
MSVIGVTGVRQLTDRQASQARAELWQLMRNAIELHVGDATGVDAIAIAYAEEMGCKVHEYRAGGFEPWQLQARSKRMVDNLAKRGGVLHAFPNKPCPAGLHPHRCKSWLGSGTWGTVCYAVSKGVPVELHLLTADVPVPGWMETEQLTLL